MVVNDLDDGQFRGGCQVNSAVCMPRDRVLINFHDEALPTYEAKCELLIALGLELVQAEMGHAKGIVQIGERPQLAHADGNSLSKLGTELANQLSL